MSRFTVPIKDILGDGFYQYELTSDNYNPIIDGSINVNCTVKNVFGNPIADKELELYKNNTSQGTATTNANGVATWTVTLREWGNQHFNVENATLDLIVKGFKQVETYQSDKVRVYRDEKTMYVIVRGSFTVNATSYLLATTTLKPIYTANIIGHSGASNTDKIVVGENGEIRLNNAQGSGSHSIYTSVLLPINQ